MRWRDVLLTCSVIVTFRSPALNAQEPPARTISLNETLIQYSLIASLAAGDYGGGTPLSQVLKEGDFGVGTFDHLEGEMILLDGTIYQALADGTIHKPELTRSTPFAVTTTFDADGQFEDFNALSLEDLDDRLNKQLPRGNSAYAIRIDGEFAALSLRSVKAQTPPYRPLVDVVKDQSVFHHKMVKGTMFGFRCPQWVGTLNVPGYHWHFISDDRTVGGHVISCVFQGTNVKYDQCTSLLIRIPESEVFDDFDINSVKPKDIDVIERQSSPKP